MKILSNIVLIFLLVCSQTALGSERGYDRNDLRNI